MLWLDNKNPAFLLREELFDDASSPLKALIRTIIAELYRFFETQPHFGPDEAEPD